MIIAAFDFDGTLTTKDSLIDFLIFSFGKKSFYRSLIKLSPTLALYKMGLITNEHAKQKLFMYFFGGMQAKKYYDLCNNYSSKIDNIINREALNKLIMHQQQNANVIIISASAEDWIKPWATKHNISRVLATKVEIINDKLTGKFITKNCYGDEKVNRLLEVYPYKEKYTLYAYGDSEGDKPLLTFADFGYYRNFTTHM